MRPTVVALVVALTLLATGCDRGSDGEKVTLDGTPRIPDAEGVVSEVSFTELTLEGGKTYRIRRDLLCFSTYTLEPLPLLQRKGQYVQLGLDGDRVVWLASIGGVVKGDPPTVYYTGHLLEVSDGRAVFRDGTTFAVPEGIEVPDAGFVQVAIDPTSAAVRGFF